jgi:hypothetical protein
LLPVKLVQKRWHRSRRWLVAFAAPLALLSLPTNPVSAAPDGTQVSAYRLPCSSSVCASGRVDDGELTAGNLQLQAKTSSAIGLSRVELQIQVGGEWTCLARWSTSARSGTWHRNFDFGSVTQGCDGDSVTDGSNGVYRVRAVATDRSGSDASPGMTLRISSPPQVPSWAAAPARVEGDDDGPAVELKWHANPEPDIVEYHFIRDDGSRVSEYAVSATRPGGQGCSLNNGVYTCIDDDFPASGYSGNYRYALAAFRSSPDESSNCSLPGSGSCVRSQNSSTQSLSMRQPPPPPADPGDTNTGNGSGSGGSRGNGNDGSSNSGSGRSDSGRPSRPRPPSLSDIAAGNYDFESGEYDLELPYEVDPFNDLPLPDPGSELGAFEEQPTSFVQDPATQRRGFIAIALGLLLIVVAAFLVRLLRSPVRNVTPQ